MKKLTVVTVTYNAEKTIENTIKSVTSQNTSFLFDYIIIDGNSTDNTLDIIKNYNNSINFWLSEKDLGIYDAMNKSLKYINSEWVIFMNSGDIFYNNFVIENTFKNANYESFNIIYGNHSFLKNDKLVIKSPIEICKIWKRMPMCHQSIFTRSELLKTFPFSLKYKYASDYDFVYNLYYKFPTKFLYVNQIISTITLKGLSESNSIQTYNEYFLISKKYNNSFNFFLYFNLKIIERKLTTFLKKIFNC